MARRRLLSDEQLAPFWAWASDDRAIVRQYTPSQADLDRSAKKRPASNQLGFAVLMCGMRFPGRVLDVTETPPAAVLAFIADQVGVAARAVRDLSAAPDKSPGACRRADGGPRLPRL